VRPGSSYRMVMFAFVAAAIQCQMLISSLSGASIRRPCAHDSIFAYIALSGTYPLTIQEVPLHCHVYCFL